MLGVAVGISGCFHSRGDVTTSTPPPPSTLFREVADVAGLRYQWQIAGKRPLNILQTIGNGCAFLDYDNDGNLDILFVGPKLALYKGDGQGHFIEVTHETGWDAYSGHFLGCAVGDVDGDGYDDLYISGYGTGLLLHNELGKRKEGSPIPNTQYPIPIFRDITREARLKSQPWGTSCAFAETRPGSGSLDLYVGNYAHFGPDAPQLCTENGLPTSCGPRHYTPIKGVFYSNDGHGHFTDVTKVLGADTASGRALGVAFGDFDGSGRPGLAIANDEMPGDLLQPSRDTAVHYKQIGPVSGTAFDRDGSIHGGMGVDWGDYDNDGKLDLFVATFYGESKSLYHNEGEGQFSDQSLPRGLASATPFVAFGCKFLDYDNDGWLDLIIANGHVQDNIQQINKATTYRQGLQLFHNNGATPALFEETTAQCDDNARRPIVGRGLAIGDYDNDGHMDILIVDAEGKPLLLHNEGKATGHWLGVHLTGTKSNRDGYGAVLTVVAGGRTQVRQCHTCGSYLSASDKRVHFGLGSASRIDTLTIRWPSGQTDTLHDLPVDKYISLTEGAAHAN